MGGGRRQIVTFPAASWRSMAIREMDRSGLSGAILASSRVVPPAGFEPALTAPEAVALSPELRGLKDRSKATSPLMAPRVVRTAAAGRPDQDHLGQVVARTSQQTLTSRPWHRDWDECSWWTTMR